MAKVGVTVVVAQAQVRQLAAPGSQVAQFWLRLLADIDRRAKAKLSGGYVKVQTGNLRSSQQPPFVTYTATGLIGVVQNVASYALPLHEGSRAHDVKARPGHFLTGWIYQGAPVFTRVAHIPEQRPRPWLRDSLREAMQAARL